MVHRYLPHTLLNYGLRLENLSAPTTFKKFGTFKNITISDSYNLFMIYDYLYILGLWLFILTVKTHYTLLVHDTKKFNFEKKPYYKKTTEYKTVYFKLMHLHTSCWGWLSSLMDGGAGAADGSGMLVPFSSSLGFCSSIPFTRSLRRTSYCRSTSLWNVSSSTAGLQCCTNKKLNLTIYVFRINLINKMPYDISFFIWLLATIAILLLKVLRTNY